MILKELPIPNFKLGEFLTILVPLILLISCQTTRPIQEGYVPRSVEDIVHIQPFSLETSYRSDWSLERQEVKNGLLVVLKIDTSLLIRRDLLEPVLYAGNQTVQRLNHGYESGYLIGIIPGDIDLKEIPVWLGEPGLPERINAHEITQQREKASRSGIVAFSFKNDTDQVQPVVTASNLFMLLRKYGAPLVFEYSPQESSLAESWQLPITGQ